MHKLRRKLSVVNMAPGVQQSAFEWNPLRDAPWSKMGGGGSDTMKN